ncbi:DAK2 domain-containing protein [Micromonospora sp. NBC_00362]|uniref:DAK2 domain-containing protein n=1 Tax=Micromonospora sp. NBC_00362 TaxID=2975975 RepID=UPI0022501941|nr:DAK2 domain-containing protein [Micromonospora sp. NBC_00362]MCX5118296.1 DAK2 domain-containing protein [Micromonospora sp. NBC_00362]
MLDTLDAAAVRRWCASGLAALKRHQGEIDQLNVYPVPDGDTGTNLVLTLTSAQQALAMDLDTLPDSGPTAHGHALRLMAQGALLGARGNSGVILSQILRGFADQVAGVPAVRGRELAAALRSGTTAAYTAVSRPVEGTVLTVVAAAAAAAEGADSDDLPTVAGVAARAAAEALARTPEQLPALARAGVVDAGGRGLCVLLDALVEVLTGERTARPAPTPRSAARPAATVARETGSDEYAYEVQFLLDAPAEAVAGLRRALDALGDSLVVVGDGREPEGTWNVHVHVNDVGAAVEAGVAAGRPYRISVTRFADQSESPSGPVVAGRAAVVVATGGGIADLFAAEGATVVPGNPSTGELLDAVRSTGAARVVVLPNDANTEAVASAAAREAHRYGIKVSVVPTRSPVQALAALAVRDGDRRFEDDVIAMAEAAGACRYAEVCHASREALTVAGPCRPGDVLALVEGEVHLIGTDLTDTCAAVVDRMLGGGGEMVTLLAGVDAPAGLTDAVRAHVARRWPFVEVHTYPGGQPFYPLLVGIE